MKFRTKLSSGFAVVVFVMLVSAIFSMRASSNMHSMAYILKVDIVPETRTISRMLAAVHETADEALNYIVNGDHDSREKAQSAASFVAEKAREYLEHDLVTDSDELAIATELAIEADVLVSVLSELMLQKDRGIDPDELLAIESNQLRPVTDALLERLDELQASHVRQLGVISDEIHRAYILGTRVTLLAIVLVTILSVVIATLTIRSILQPVRRLHDGMGAVGQGDLDCIIAENTRDELGLLATQFNRTVARLRETTTTVERLNREITDRQQAESETAKFKAIADHAAYGVMIADLDGHITYVNDWWILMHGYSRDEISGRHLSMFHNEEQMEEVTEIIRELYTTGSFSSQEIGHKHKDGTVISTLMSGVMIRDEQDNPCYMAATVINITDRKRVEDALRVSEKRFYDVAMSSANWIWEVDVNGRYTYTSGNVEKFLGYSPEEMIGRTPFEMMPDEEAERIGKIFAIIVAEKKPIVDLENWNVARDGRKVCLLTNGVPVLDEDGELVGYRGVDKDISKRKLAEEALKRTMSELKRFNQSAVDRELQVIELKEEINRLCTHAGQEPKYRIVREEAADATLP